jgi:photosystem II stability/assembly factor-like uncharacterized protein
LNNFFLSLVFCLSSSLAVGTFSPSAAFAQNQWTSFGPDGGDARSFATDPRDHQHILLGTTNGTIYDSHDGGVKWTRLSRIGHRDDLVLDNIVVDPVVPDHIYVGAWGLGYAGGGFYTSTDAGATWMSNASMDGHSVLALTIAPSDPKILLIGALDGIFRSIDGGNTWKLISPDKSKELHEVESIAVDPKDPRIIFAGTWHLPWKTTDGGEHWTNMKQGIIDDSDVFSIIVDPTNPQSVFLSACSGIYHSTDDGNSFAKVQGIPATARRTRVLMEDSTQANVVFAGTTEGLWRTTDSGHSFQRYGDPSWIINDVSIDKQDSKRVLLATDRTGVLLSTDGGLTFTSSNRGFSSRKISAVLQEGNDGRNLIIGVINDKAAGGVFRSPDGGMTWVQNSAGLGGADVLSLVKTSKGTLLAGTRHGIYRLEDQTWQMSGLTLALPVEATSDETPGSGSRSVRGGHAANKRAPSLPTKGRSSEKRQPHPTGTTAQQLTAAVYALASDDTNVIAATEEGLLTSADDGRTWNRVRTAAATSWRQVTAQGSLVVVSDVKSIEVSLDGGASFHPVAAPAELTLIAALAIDNAGRVWIGGREGVYLSEDRGSTWHSQRNLFVPDVSGLYFDQANSRLLVTSNQPGSLIFGVHLPDMTVKHWESGWVLREVRPVGEHLVGITPYDGIVLQPEASTSEVSSK